MNFSPLSLLGALAALAAPARFVAGEPGRVGAAAASKGDRRWRSMGWVRSQFKRTDDGSGGRLQTLRRGLKFWWRCWWHAAPLRVSTRAFHDSRLDSIVETEPALPLRPLRSYLRRGLDSSRRAHAVQSHFAWLSGHFSRPWIDRLYTGETIPLLADAPWVEGLGISLSCAAHLGREGELAVHLEWQGERAMSIAFSVVDARLVVASATFAAGLAPAGGLHGARAVIGSIQGTRGAGACLRALSAATQRLRPGALLVLAVQGLSAAWGPAGAAGRGDALACVCGLCIAPPPRRPRLRRDLARCRRRVTRPALLGLAGPPGVAPGQRGRVAAPCPAPAPQRLARRLAGRGAEVGPRAAGGALAGLPAFVPSR